MYMYVHVMYTNIALFEWLIEWTLNDHLASLPFVAIIVPLLLVYYLGFYTTVKSMTNSNLISCMLVTRGIFHLITLQINI